MMIANRVRRRAVILSVSLLALALAACGLSREIGVAERPGIAGLSREVAVTFDDLPVISVTPLDAAERRDVTTRLLATIRAHGVPAVGFVNEYQLYGWGPSNGAPPDPNDVALLRLWLDAGLELGNHTFGHSDLHKTSLTVFQDDVVRGEAVTGSLLRERGRRLRYFRHPYLHTGLDLDTNRGLGRFLALRGYHVAPVTIDPDDYVFAAAYAKAAARGERDLMARLAAAYVAHVEQVVDDCQHRSLTLFGRAIRHVLLLHANGLNADHFDDVARMLKRRGYAFITLDAALRDDAYASPDTYTGDESIDWLARWAITKGIQSIDNVFDDSPEIPQWVVQAADAI